MNKFYRALHYPRNTRRSALIQEQSMQPFVGMLAVYAAMIYWLISRHESLLWPGILGAFATMAFSNIAGRVKARNAFVEAGFNGRFFYLASVWDIASARQVDYFPLEFANPSMEGGSLFVNYKGQIVRLNVNDWRDMPEMSWYFFNYEQYMQQIQNEQSETNQSSLL